MIYFENVSKQYSEGSPALEEVNLEIKPGELVSIVGHSGAGKTTLVKMLLAEERPTAGRVFFEETDVHSLRRRAISDYRRRIGIIFQDFRLLPHKNAFENVAFAMEAAGKSDEAILSDVPYALKLVDLEEKQWNFPHELSGGEKQRVAIARAIVNQPDVLIADEPTGNLDPANTYDVVQIIKKINDLGTTIILTTHNHGVVESLGNRVITMERGRVVDDNV